MTSAECAGPEWLEEELGANALSRELFRTLDVRTPSSSILTEMGDGPDLEDLINDLVWSKFSARKDSYFYSALLGEAMKRFAGTHHFVDVGCGSGIPLIMAALRTGKRDSIRAALYDSDPEAILIASGNLEKSHLDENVSACVRSIEDFVSSGEISLDEQIVCVNPPYIPYHVESVPERFLPVVAGEDGLKYTSPFLAARYGTGSRLVLEWSSLSDVRATINQIFANFEVEYARKSILISND